MSGKASGAAADRPLTDREFRALAQFRHSLRVFLRFSEESARQAGITPAQHQLLLAIRGFPEGAPAIGEVAEMLQVRHHSALELVHRAQDAGFVATTVDPDDHRRQLLDITPQGAAILETLSAAHRDELRGFRRRMADLLDELG